jgi:hypothetical protein
METLPLVFLQKNSSFLNWIHCHVFSQTPPSLDNEERDFSPNLPVKLG